MYEFCSRIAGFGSLSRNEAIGVITHLASALQLADASYLRQHPEAPYLYESGVYYCRDRAIEKQWWDIPSVLRNGCADCKALAAWRAAELQVRFGIPATIHVDTEDGELFHVTVVARGIEEDPSALLGMRS